MGGGENDRVSDDWLEKEKKKWRTFLIPLIFAIQLYFLFHSHSLFIQFRIEEIKDQSRVYVWIGGSQRPSMDMMET